MEINNKDIWRDIKKCCIICENEFSKGGIQIMNNCICEKCVQRMNILDIGTEEYEITKNKIKNAILKKDYKVK